MTEAPVQPEKVSSRGPLVGVLALQGGFEAHERMLRRLGAEVREVRTVADLDGLEGLVIPGGESTTMTLGIEREGLAEPLRRLVRGGGRGASGDSSDSSASSGASSGDSGDSGASSGASGDSGASSGDSGDSGASSGDGDGGARGVPVLGSCAGMIMLDREHLGLMDMRAKRNAFGRQLQSFETDLEMRGIGGDRASPGSLRAVFIRAPWVQEHGPGVEVLAEVDGHPVAVREDGMLAVAFHAELTDDDRVHKLFLDAVSRRSAGRPARV